METTIESKTCRLCNTPFNITDKDLEFYEKASPIFSGRKLQIPTPTLCPDCRLQRRLSFRNERNLYHRKCDFSGKNIISMISPDKPFKVYESTVWYSDRWNPLDYGRDFDFSRPFFEQFKELLLAVPRVSIYQQGDNENSEYTNTASNNKSCFLIFSSNFNENCAYGVQMNGSRDSFDAINLLQSENCYEVINSKKCYKCFFSQYCTDCSESYFLRHCTGCDHCMFCYNLVNKKYCIFNKQYTEKEYKIESEKLLRDFNQLKCLFEEQPKDIIVKSYNGENNENVTGDHLFNSSNLKECFDCADSENLSYCNTIIGSKNCMDFSYWGRNNELMYEVHGSGYNCSKMAFVSQSATDNSNLYYCDICNNGIKDCFGCVGLNNHKQYCIFNKQYTKEEYEILVPKVIEHMMKTGEWGEFFPSNISPFGYNETVAQEYFPLSRDEVVEARFIASNSVTLDKEERGNVLYGRLFNWSDYEIPFPKVEKIISADKLPNDISKIPDDILNWAIQCEITKKPFRIIKPELEFYRKHNLPIPHKHPDQRHLERMQLRNPRKLFQRKCDKCGIEMQTTYSPDRPQKVYCEKCYNEAVY